MQNMNFYCNLISASPNTYGLRVRMYSVFLFHHYWDLFWSHDQNWNSLGVRVARHLLRKKVKPCSKKAKPGKKPNC